MALCLNRSIVALNSRQFWRLPARPCAPPITRPNTMNDDSTGEAWRPSPTHPGYEASSLGRIRNAKTGRVLRPRVKTNGYLQVTLAGRTVIVHTVVLQAFVGPRPDGCEASHLSGDRADNRPDNLTWESRSRNNQRKYSHGTMPVGERHFRAKQTTCRHGHPYTEANTIRRKGSGHRECRTCAYRRRDAYMPGWRARRRAA
jgi:hypothetical protein